MFSYDNFGTAVGLDMWMLVFFFGVGVAIQILYKTGVVTRCRLRGTDYFFIGWIPYQF